MPTVKMSNMQNDGFWTVSRKTVGTILASVNFCMGKHVTKLIFEPESGGTSAHASHRFSGHPTSSCKLQAASSSLWLFHMQLAESSALPKCRNAAMPQCHNAALPQCCIDAICKMPNMQKCQNTTCTNVKKKMWKCQLSKCQTCKMTDFERFHEKRLAPS